MLKDYVLFDRYVSITAGTLQLNGLDAAFHIQKDLSTKPATCELLIYNLSEASRKALHELKEIKVNISAGYKGAVGQNNTNTDAEFLIFSGDLNQVFSQKDGPDWITTIRTADGLDSHQQSLISKSFKESTTYSNIVEQMLHSTTLDFKKAVAKLKSGDIPGALRAVLSTHVVHGAVSKELEKKFSELNVTGVIINNELHILKPGEYLGTEAVELTPSTGLIGSPEIDTSGYIRFTTLIRPEFNPGYAVKIKTASFDGLYRIERLSYNATTFDENWYIQVEASPL